MKPLKLMLPLAALGALVLVPVTASAGRNDPGIYLGGGIGYERIKADGYAEEFPDDTDDLSDNRVGYKGFAGYRFGPILAIEGQYIDFGDATDGDLNVEANGWTAGVVVNIPITQFLIPYVKGGALMWDADASISGVPGKVSDDGTDPFFGVGLKLGLGDNLDLRFEYERLKLDDVDVDLASANLQFNF